MTARRCLLSLVVLLPFLFPTAAPAETVVEAWRSPFGFGRAVSVNPTDASVWAATGSSVMHLAADGAILGQTNGFLGPSSVSANPSDGSCWVADQGEWNGSEYVNSAVVHLSAAGTELWRGGDFNLPWSVSVNPTDGSCWVADILNHQVVHLSSAGAELWRGDGFYWPVSVSVNPSDDSCWVADTATNQVVHLSSAGTEMWRGGPFYMPESVAVNPSDGSCWVADTAINQVVQLSAAGTEMWRGGGFNQPLSVSVNPSDGSCWVADTYNNQVVHLSVAGTELWRGGGFSHPESVSMNPSDGSCWVADTGNSQVVHLVIPGWKPSVFYDVPWYHWAYDYVNACFDAGIVRGYADGLYHPTYAVTRDQMAVFIARALAGGDEQVPTGPETATFPDVPSDHWAFRYIEYCHDQAVVQGYWDGYHPGEIVTRGQMAVYVARSMVAPSGDAAIPDPEPPPTFPDVPDSYWAYKWIEYCHGQGVVQGYWDGYRPEETANRAQMAVYVQRAFDLPL
jgi:DNA-binding beta-propeller fold protein YncE